jgi:hypothetical protein
MTDLTTWQGKTPSPDLAPLTLEWFKTAMHPRHSIDGAVTYILTPPRKDGSIGWGLVGIGLILLLGAAFFWPLIKIAAS